MTDFTVREKKMTQLSQRAGVLSGREEDEMGSNGLV
jgi:hypothetical protein